MWPTRDDILAARGLIRTHIRRTPCMDLRLPSGRTIALKLELLQHTGSFKPRGAFTTVLSQEHPPSALVAASGGNHGMAVAYVGQRLGIPASIFVPETAPATKVARLHAYGARVHQVGNTFAEALTASREEAGRPGTLAIHAYDAMGTVTGQGTIGVEIEEQTSPDTVLVAVGGGGLIGGVASWFRDGARIVGVEPQTCNALNAALAASGPVQVNPTGVAADSLGASMLGEIAWEALQAASIRSVLVGDDDIAAARELLWRETRLVAEPGGATALAALLSGAYEPAYRERVTVIVCGSNCDPSDLPLE
ncbi:threonine/serine dehydratase [Leekyejoonella antrihumi]|uniref:threonine ammonia-lyase n=1 Tax=Leekyejoonella antrihumi TaxID=1660198 RepID=A0A563E659_9MICO|nr:threonine/serine dehydratase [Leekyejoonella antrihumi]TWP37915.1 threonine/serine dehydratase [Leekyejoonella antrihumi]